MKKVLLLFCLVALSLTVIAQHKPAGSPLADPTKITKDLLSFLYYQRDYLRLSEDFTACDASGKEISKGVFLSQLTKFKYIPLKLKSGFTYQLYPIPKAAFKGCDELVAQLGNQYLDAYIREGKPVAPYKLVDLNGKVYTPANTKGKILVLKCWFLACGACVEEIPQLNKMVQQYKNRKDILFVSMVIDKPAPTKAFLAKKRLDYAVVTEKGDYMSNGLKVNTYPTHFVIDKNGNVVKMVNDANELEVVLYNVVNKTK